MADFQFKIIYITVIASQKKVSRIKKELNKHRLIKKINKIQEIIINQLINQQYPSYKLKEQQQQYKIFKKQLIVKVQSIQRKVYGINDSNIRMKYYNTKHISKWTLNFKKDYLEEQFHQQNKTKDFFFFQMMILSTFLWSIISITIDGISINMGALLGVLFLSFLIIRVPHLKFCQYYIFVIQILACIAIPYYNLSNKQPYWRIYLNGAASVLWMFVGYQSFVMESISIAFQIIAPIYILKMQYEYIVVLGLFMLLLITSRYINNRSQRLLFLALQSFEQWQEAIEKTVPTYFIVSRFEFITHQMYLHDQNKKFQKFMEAQQSTKKFGSKNSEDNKLYIEFLKNCEIEYAPSQPFSPASAGGVRSHGNSYSNKNSNVESIHSNQNLYGFGTGKNQVNNNNLLSSVHLKVGNQYTNNTPSSATQAINTLFDLLLKKHDQLYNETTQAQNKKGRKSLQFNQNKPDDKKIKTNNNDFAAAAPGDSRRNTILAQNLFTNIDENGVQQNQLLKEEQIKVIYKSPSSLSIQKFKVKIVPLIMQEPLLAISLQDITLNEEEKKVKKIEQDNNAINLQVISKIKSHLEYLNQNLSKVKSQKMKQAIIFPLNIIRSTAAIEKNKITYEQFGVNQLFKELASTFPNLAQVKVKNNSENLQNQNTISSYQKRENSNNTLNQNANQDEQEKMKEFDLIDPQSFEELDDQEMVKQQKETIAKKYNLAGVISANHDFLSFSLQEKQFYRQKSNLQSSMQTLGAENLALKGYANFVDSEQIIPYYNFQKKINLTETAAANKDKFNSCQNIYIGSQIDNDFNNTQRIHQENEQNHNTSAQFKNFYKSISNDNIGSKKQNKMVNKFSQQHLPNTVNTSPAFQKVNPLTQSKSSISYKVIKQQLISQINNNLKQFDESQQNNKSQIGQLEQKNKLNIPTSEDLQKRGLTLYTTTTGLSQQQYGSFMQTKCQNQIEKEDTHEDLNSEKVSNKIQTAFQINQNNFSTQKILSDQNLLQQNNNIQNASGVQLREDRHSSIGQVSSNNFPSINQIEFEANQNLVKKHNFNQQVASNKLIVQGDNKNQDASVFTNLPHIKTSTQLETEANDVMSEKEKKLNTLFNNQSKNSINQPEIQIHSNYRLIFQALCGIITCFGKQDVQIIIENYNKKLYNSLKFTVKCIQNENQTNKKTNQNSEKKQEQKQIFNFENSPSINNSPQQNTYQYSMFPSINTHTHNPPNSILSPSSNFQSENNTPLKQITVGKVTKFNLLSTNKVMKAEEDFKKNLYDLSYLSSKHLSNKIWNSIKDIACLLGPEKLEYHENTISIEFFTNMNIIKNQQMNPNIPFQNTKPNRNSLFSIQHNLQNQMFVNNINSQTNINNSQFQPNNSNMTYYTPQLNVQPNFQENVAQSIININNSSIVLANVINNNLNINNINNEPNTSIANAQNISRLDPQTASNKNSFNNLQQQQNTYVSFQQYLSLNSKHSDQNYRPSSQQSIQIQKQPQKVQTIFPVQQQSSNQPFMVNSKLRIPEEEEQSPYKKRQYSQVSLSLMSLQSQQDEGINQVQPIKNFLNQNAKFNN
ncbi:transmembrane protein, putative (macronuclear) [Tetrahymena thermophila SB210]|uniref:Transmembrane protein, putative n=1 Tax=Tetrahymena thermophila (strain SB210) TaxID=312017 RepID=I7MKH8_TETTS|nr:transmembrane protein, putative [Tetrahymena thermophila SB210]EAR98453.2 transmembrane protein, putative [Tetrahymena thermophila SB210]|eukprot:XP_001018698.2 transmembrane protein, putative [Tetrahymena thermophila SB210]